MAQAAAAALVAHLEPGLFAMAALVEGVGVSVSLCCRVRKCLQPIRRALFL